MRGAVLLLGAMVALLVAARAGAATLDPVGQFELPIYVTSMPSDPDRLLVVEQAGRIQLVDQGIRSTFLDIDDLVVSGGEQGLFSVALAPEYDATGHLYVFYTQAGSNDLQIDEFTASGNTVPRSSRRKVLTIPHRTATNHNGGQLQFGPDGYLYIATGDGGGIGDPEENAQDLSTRLGKILRIDPRRSGTEPYTVPLDNPFLDVAGAKQEIWSYGLRNPWRFSFDRATGALLVGDVGQDDWEEVDYAEAPPPGAGLNFGWDCREGRHSFEPAGCPPESELTNPIFEYSHSKGGIAITGGYVVRDPSLGNLYGRYLYADLAQGEIRSLVPALPNATDDREEGLHVQSPVSFGEDSCGRLYVASFEGEVFRLVGDTPAICTEPPANPGPVDLGPPNSENPGSPAGPMDPAGPPAGRCAGQRATIVATRGSPTVGTSGPDVIAGSPARDTIRGRGGKDRICGAGSKDRLRGNGGADRLRGGAGRDKLAGGQRGDKLVGGYGGDTVAGGTGRDSLKGGPGRDRCRSGAGKDKLRSC